MKKWELALQRNNDFHSLKTNDILQTIFNFFKPHQLQIASQVCKQWRTVSIAAVRRALVLDFNIPTELASRLHSPNLIYHNLTTIMRRGVCKDNYENILYRLYCSSGVIDEDFLHILDDDLNWFKQYIMTPAF